MLFLKHFFVLILLSAVCNQNIYSLGGELWIYNYSSNNIWVHVYPVSMIFNNDNFGTNGRNYSLLGPSNVMEGNGVEKYFINGSNVYEWNFQIVSGGKEEWGFDNVPGSDDATKGTISYGRWRVDFYNSANINGQPMDYCILDYDFGYEYHNGLIGCTQQPGDLYLSYNNEIFNQTHIKYLWKTCECAHSSTFEFIPENRTLLERVRCPEQSWPPEKGNFRYNSGSPWDPNNSLRAPNNYAVIPQDPRRDCVTDVYPDPPFTNFKSHNQFFRYAYTINYLDYYYPADIGTLK